MILSINYKINILSYIKYLQIGNKQQNTKYYIMKISYLDDKEDNLPVRS